MKVRCTKILDTYGRPQQQSAWLTVGKTYHVLSIEHGGDQRWMLRLIGDGLGGVALFPMEQFEVVTSVVSPSWHVKWEESGSFTLEPAPWSRSGFWVKYYDGDSVAAEIFEEESRKIIDAEGTSPP